MAAPSTGARVIIVGGGPVGLGAAIELARFGVRTVLLEQRATTSWHPKTRNVNTRTMEIVRGWGRTVYGRMRGIDTPPGWKSPIRFLRSVVGEEVARIESKGFEGPGLAVSPALPVMSSQDHMEKIYCDAARATGLVDLRFGHQVTGVRRGGRATDTDAAVDVLNKASGETVTLTGAALVAADGVDSTVRNHLGIALDGARDVSFFVNCYFRSDIERHVGARRGVLFFVVNEHAAGVLQPLDACGRWLCQMSVSPAEWESGVFDEERCRTWVRAAVGVDALDVDVVSIGRWRMNATVADGFVHGRVVLCGDAAHQFPPTGGLGVNTGLQGMHNAMWKLALCVRGEAAWTLLATYDDERRGVARRTTEQSLQNYVNVGRIVAAAMMGEENAMSTAEAVVAARRYGNHLGVEFGSVYESSAVIPDGTVAPEIADAYSDYVQSPRPGCRAPHLWLGRGDEVLSTIDLFGAGFTVLTGSGGSAWREAAAHAAAELGVPLACYAIDDAGLEDRDGVFLDRYGIGPDGAVLVRPDGYVAWRIERAGDTATAGLIRAMRRILGAPT